MSKAESKAGSWKVGDLMLVTDFRGRPLRAGVLKEIRPPERPLTDDERACGYTKCIIYKIMFPKGGTISVDDHHLKKLASPGTVKTLTGFARKRDPKKSI